ncbi:ABC transporter permease [Nocardia miyunensis]|uniref:ABC transporter permease n=1 Tax=Nocardia miyunensis TaxID=282684 RepID=UPI0009FC7B6B
MRTETHTAPNISDATAEPGAHPPRAVEPTPHGGEDRSAPTSSAHSATGTSDTARPAPRRLRTVIAPLAVLALVIGVWYVISYALLTPARRFLMPPPQQVITDGLLGPQAQEMWQALGRTATVAGVGLVIAVVLGIVWAVLMAQARWAETALFPYAVIMQCIPILALVPLIGFWFGFGFISRVFVCVLIALFPIVSNTLFGLKSVDKGLRELFALRTTSRWTVLRKLEFPAAMPAIFAGLRISAGLSVVGAIVGDFFFKQGDPGIGILLDNYRSRLQAPQLFAAILLASALGVVVFVLFGWLGRRIVGAWYDDARH